MAGKRARWLIGCGAGCGLVVVALAVISAAGYVYLGRFFAGVGEAARSHRELVSRYGDVREFTPAPDGAVPPSRIELFLSVREELGEPRARLRAVLSDFPPDDVIEEDRAFFKVVGAVRGVTGLVGPIATYVDERNGALLQAGMGLGEYVYIYGTGYYSWLGRSPADGPVITKDIGEGPPGGENQLLFGDVDSSFHPATVRRRYRRCMLDLLRNQLAALPEPGGSAEAGAWRAQLEAEIRRFESRPDRVAWSDGLPPGVAASYEPFRSRFESTWDAAANPFEIPLGDAEVRGRRDRD